MAETDPQTEHRARRTRTDGSMRRCELFLKIRPTVFESRSNGARFGERQRLAMGSGLSPHTRGMNPVRRMSLFSLPRPRKKCRGLLPPQSRLHRGRLTVVLDMDETLLHSQFASQRDRFRQAECRPDGASFAREADFDFTIRVNRTHRERVAVYKRPGLDTFLREAAARFEVIVFTAAIPLYAARVLDLLDPDQKYISARLFREATVVFQNMPYVKDISVLGRDPARVVIVDNNPGALIASPDNAIPISSYYADSDDNELAKLGALLTKLSQARDVRPSLEKKFRFRLLLDQARRLRDAYSERFV